jgi:probable rRNA maturation factor
MIPLDISVVVADELTQINEDVVVRWVDGLTETVQQVAALDMPDSAELSVLVTDDAQVADLNNRFRGKSGSTNILSFPVKQVQVGEMPPPMLGDLVFAFPTVAREATEQGKSIDAHFQHLFIHGLLHLFGYDHENDTDAVIMEALEVEVLARLGLENPYQ